MHVTSSNMDPVGKNKDGPNTSRLRGFQVSKFDIFKSFIVMINILQKLILIFKTCYDKLFILVDSFNFCIS